MLNPRHDGDGFTGAAEAVNHCGLVKKFFTALDQYVLIFAQNAKSLDGFIVENPKTMTGYELQDIIVETHINCLGGIIHNALDPVGELIATKHVLEDVESWGFWVCPRLGARLLAISWLLIEREMPSWAGPTRLVDVGFHVGPNRMGIQCIRWNMELTLQHFSEGFQLGDGFLPCAVACLDNCITLHLRDENIVATLKVDETALVDLSDDAWAPTNHSDPVEANDLYSRNVTATFFN